jgi:DNA-binding response OmpR family regulator
MKVLVVEDSEEYQKIIARTLGEFNVTCTSSAEEAGVQLRNSTFDLALIDINLPKKDGYTLISEMQSNPETSSMPIMCITGRASITDKITAFSLGADDYITKPFDPLELLARINSKLKKRRKQQDSELRSHIGGIEIDHARHRVLVDDGEFANEVNLTQTEFKILCCLARRPEQVFTRDQLLVAAWGGDAQVLERVVDAHVCLLRKKLSTKVNYIKPVSGIGYKLQIPKK